MSIPDNYTRELENLILTRLLPVYEDWCRLNKKPVNISPQILANLHKKANIAALLTKPEKQNA